MSENIKRLKYIKQLVVVSEMYLKNDDQVLYASCDVSQLKSVLFLLRNHSHFRFESLLDIFAVDYKTFFELTYVLLSVRKRCRIVLKVRVEKLELVSSVSNFFESGIWLEREVFDMFGVVFEGNSDLRRILMDYGSLGFPLLKDYPLTGYQECRYDEKEKKLVYELNELNQAYRNYTFEEKWS